MAHREVNLRERRAIEEMLNARIAVHEIAAEIGRHVSTVYREIKRNRYDDNELPELNDTTLWLLNAPRPRDARDVGNWCASTSCAKP